MKALNHTAYLEDAIKQLKCSPTDSCVLWPFYTDPVKGYGYVTHDGKNSTVHHAAFQLHYGQEPENMVLHSCSNASCFNPLHLYDGTAKDNMRDMIEDWGYHPGGRRKLTEENVIQIIELLKQHVRQDIIAARFDVSRPTISAINIGKTWQHISRSGKPAARTRRSPKTGIILQFSIKPQPISSGRKYRKRKESLPEIPKAKTDRPRKIRPEKPKKIKPEKPKKVKLDKPIKVKPQPKPPKPKPPTLSPQQLQTAQGLHIRGFTYKEIAPWFSIKPTRLMRLLKAA